ncbi:MAG: hypothetical protein JWM52_882 [Candidatus Saccharibacteria bacterium]|nr:hypothetical protein [Candidatus Saccharibacteria bacterium]
MRTVDLVRRQYDRLNSEFETAIKNGAEKRSYPFYEWAVGRVLLGTEETKSVLDSVAFGAGHGGVIRDVYDSFLETGDHRLIPALTFDKDGKPIVIVVIQP